jgi:hypothetical protein
MGVLGRRMAPRGKSGIITYPPLKFHIFILSHITPSMAATCILPEEAMNYTRVIEEARKLQAEAERLLEAAQITRQKSEALRTAMIVARDGIRKLAEDAIRIPETGARSPWTPCQPD